MVIYCIFAREDIGRMFMAGVVPGLLMMAVFIAVISIWVALKPSLAPNDMKLSLRERISTVKKIWSFILLFGVVLGGMYLGVFTATEAASIGAFGAWLFSYTRGGMRRVKDYIEVIGGAVGISASIFAIAACANVFAQFINVSGMPYAMVALVQALDFSGVELVLAIGFLCILLGMVFESLGILVLIIPLFLPSLQAQGVDLIWFGIITIILIELGLITPPVGVNVFTVKASYPDLNLRNIFIGIAPFVFAMISTAVLIIIFPGIATALPNMMR
jgi:tripartite ATP-independent transporter DctM subunit